MFSNTGGGHKASADALRDVLKEKYGDKYQVGAIVSGLELYRKWELLRHEVYRIYVFLFYFVPQLPTRECILTQAYVYVRVCVTALTKNQAQISIPWLGLVDIRPLTLY